MSAPSSLFGGMHGRGQREGESSWLGRDSATAYARGGFRAQRAQTMSEIQKGSSLEFCKILSSLL